MPQRVFDLILERFGYWLPWWCWLTVFGLVLALGVAHKTAPAEIPLGRKGKPSLRKRDFLLALYFAIPAVIILSYLLAPCVLIRGTLCDSDDSITRVDEANVVVKSWEHELESTTTTDQNGHWEVDWPRRRLGRAVIKVTDTKERYLPAEVDCELKKERFFVIRMESRLPDYTILFQDPLSHIDVSSLLKVRAVFQREDMGGTVRIPNPRENVELRIDGITKPYNERSQPYTDRVTFEEPLENYELGKHEVLVITRFTDSDGKELEIPGKRLFTSVWRDSFETVQGWYIPEGEKSDWKLCEDGIRGELQLGDRGNLLRLRKEIPWGPVAIAFETQILNSSFLNVIVELGERHRVILGDGDLQTIRVQRLEYVGKKTEWVLLGDHRLEPAISPDDWLSVAIEFHPGLNDDGGFFYLELLYPMKTPFFKEIMMPFQGASVPERGHRVALGHVNPWYRKKQAAETSIVMFRNFRIYVPIR